MTPVICQVKHDPDNGKYGDCVRACIASLMDMASADVPHFYHDNCDGETGTQRIRDWLKSQGHALLIGAEDGATSLEDLLTGMGQLNPDVHYVLQGSINSGNHVVVCKGDKIVHNPAWFREAFIGPASNGVWTFMVIARA